MGLERLSGVDPISLVQEPPEPKVESSTLSSRPSLRSQRNEERRLPRRSETMAGVSPTSSRRATTRQASRKSAFSIGFVMSSEIGWNHRPNQNKNQNNGVERMKMGA